MGMKKANVIKKMLMFVLTVCLIVPCFTILTYAAEGKVMFTDPSTKVGETVEVRGVLQTNGVAIEDREIVMSYDTSMLKFMNGDSVTENTAGQLTYSVSGTVESDGRVEFMMSFRALKEGTAKIEVESYKAWTAGENYEAINCSLGSAAIAISAGEAPVDEPNDEPVNDPTNEPSQSDEVVVNGKTYTFSSEFAQADIPEGFTQTSMEYAGKQYDVVYSDNYGMYLGYLIDAEQKGDFFLYVAENATFAPFAEISVSDTTKIVLMSDVEGIKLPETFSQTTVLVNGVEFPAWQNTDKLGFCILYAVNSNGQKSLYQFDTAEGTYQKFEAPALEEEEKNDSFIGKLSDSLKEHLDILILVGGIGFVLFLVIIVVLSVKLYNRNAELDEIYDEYGIDFEEDEEPVVKNDRKKDKKSKKNQYIEEDEKTEILGVELDKELNQEETVAANFESETVSEPEESVVLTDEDDDFSIDLSSILEDDPEEEIIKQEDTKQESEEFGETLDTQENISNKETSKDDFFDDDDDDLSYEIDFIDLDD